MNQEPKTNLDLINEALNLISAKFKQHNDAILNLQVRVKDLSFAVTNLQRQIEELKK
jgi:predicted  nucleic acid-binding Zn-ribbon protein